MTPAAKPRPSTAAVAAALLTVYIVWGSTYLAIAVMIETLPPLLAAGIRFLVAGVLVLGAVVAYARLRGRTLERPRLVHWRSAAIVGTLLLAGGNGGVVLAELRIPSGVAAVLVATTPIWLAVFDAILTRRRPSALVIGGLVAGIIGVAVLLAPVEGFGELDPLGVGLVIVAEIAWASGSLYARHAPLPRSGLLLTGMEMVAGGAALLLAGTLLGELGQADVGAFSLRSLLAVGYLIVFGSIVAFTAYTWLLANTSVAIVGTHAYVNPVVAVALGAILLSEPITPRMIIASVIIIAAVVAMVSGRPQAAEEAGPNPKAAAHAAETDGTDRAREASG
jgi:drug/metabolite transporter (DMT)-like permease